MHIVYPRLAQTSFNPKKRIVSNGLFVKARSFRIREIYSNVVRTVYRVYTCILSFVSSEADNYFTIKSPNSTNIRLTTPLTRSIANLKVDDAWGGVRGQALQKFRNLVCTK